MAEASKSTGFRNSIDQEVLKQDSRKFARVVGTIQAHDAPENIKRTSWGT